MEQPLTKDIRPGNPPPDITGYEKTGGYQAVRKVLQKMSASDVIEAVKESKLNGRGGAGFPTGLKWSFVPRGDDSPKTKYLIANADEMEPGTFKDRLLLEGNPHQLIEGMILSAYAIQANTGYIFLRWAYKTAAEVITKSLAEAYNTGYLGTNILGSEFTFNIRLHTSVGRYMCGEETGLLNALEGKRAHPRAKPPFPQISGLFGKPTIVNNVETLSCIPHIINNGADWFQNLSLTEEGGTKLYGVSGRVKNPNIWELPLGTSMREIIEDHAGGMQDGYQLRGVLPGGASTDFLTPDHMDIAMSFDGITKAGSRLGTGTLIILDDHTCPVGFVQNLEHFFAQESCGWCTPCREGLPWIEKILHAIEEGKGEKKDIDILQSHTKWLGPGMTFCALAPGAMEPLQSALKYYREDFERHISDKKCPWRE
jgi:NADH-quinone oxidoreductase subunit F